MFSKKRNVARGLLELKAEAVGSSRIDLSWPNYGNIPLYLSYRNQQDREWKLIELPSGEVVFAFVGLVPGAAYEFQLFSLGKAVSEIVAATVEETDEPS